eukprot:495503-Amphidinium_carterae.1
MPLQCRASPKSLRLFHVFNRDASRPSPMLSEFCSYALDVRPVGPEHFAAACARAVEPESVKSRPCTTRAGMSK